jgi:phosphoglycolate phosphatase
MLSGGSGGEPLVKRLVRTYRERYETLGVFESTLYPGIEAMLRSLRGESGRTLSVVTSKPTLYATKILNHFGIAPLFGVVVGSRIDEDMSEKTGLLRRVVGARESDGGLEGYLMIGDREHDTLGARNVGIDSVGVLYGYGSEFEITSARPTFVVPSVRALRSLLARQ